MWPVAELEVIDADVTALDVDAIANAANTQLIHGGGVAGAISRAGGPDVQRESDERAPIGLGEAVETTAGDMPCRWVIHAATMELGGPTSADIIERATRSTLARAEELGARSLALVAFGTGVGGFPLTEAARIMVGVGARASRPARPAGADRLRGARRGRGARLPRGALSLPVLVAPDSFKGTFSAREVAAAIAAGLRSADREARELPVADGGEGTMEVLVTALGGEVRVATVSDPLGRPIEAGFALLPDGTAVVEMAQASGLSLVDEAERDAWAASTRGTGELIVAAVEAGAVKVVVTVGGSATTDGGAGALEALDEAGVKVPMDVVCDVRTPYEDAPRVFAPQKGADAAMVKRLERRQAKLADRLPRDPRGEPMTGAAGGLSGGLWAAYDARLVPGAPYVLDAIGFDPLMRGSAFVVTGEGGLDNQTLQGKIVGEVATRCRQAGVTCHAIVGRNELEPFSERIIDLASVTGASTLAEIEAAARALV